MAAVVAAIGGSIEQLREVVDQLVALDPAECSDAGLAAELLGLRRELDRLEGQFARLAAAGHARGVGSVDGAASTAAWLRHRAGMRTGDAKAAIQAGQDAALLEETGAAWRAGEITAGAARTIFGARVPGHEEPLVASEPVLLGLARRGDLRSLKLAADHARNLARADGTEPSEHDGLQLSKTYDGRTLLSAELSDENAEVVATALHAYVDPPTEGDTRTTALRYAAALRQICEVAIAHAADRGRAVPQITVVVDWATLTAGVAGRCDGAFTGSIHPDAIRTLLCDCSISRVVTGPDGLPLDVGRARRTATPGQRRALAARDGGCRFPGCDRPPGWCQVHHTTPWEEGGLTNVDDMLLFCDCHHHIVHSRGWIVVLDGHDLHILRPDGSEVT